MKTRILLSLIFFFNLTSFHAQKRVGLDVSTRLTNLNLTLTYNHLLKKNFLFSTGIYSGGSGIFDIKNDTINLTNGKGNYSPYSIANVQLSDSFSTYGLYDYYTRTKSIGIQIGIGYFWELGVIHGIRANLNAKLGYSTNKIRGYYRSTKIRREISRVFYASHVTLASSIELAHTMRIQGRYTFYYGIKAPYFFNVDKKNFNPRTQRVAFYGFEPEFTLGLTRVIGKCD